MGTYATSANVEVEFKDVDFDASGAAVSNTDVDTFITQEEALLESRVGGVYSTPITGTRAIAIMKMMTIFMVKARILDILYVKTGTSADQADPAQALRDRVDKMVEAIVNKTMPLMDATLLSSSAGIQSYQSEEEIDPIFERDTEQW